MKIDIPRQQRENRVRILIQPVDSSGKAGKSGQKSKSIPLCDTTVDKVYELCMKIIAKVSVEGG